MGQEPTNEIAIYNSSYLHGVDEKRRVQIPAKWRPSQPDVEFTIIVWLNENQSSCLRVLPPKKMAELMRDLDAMPNTDARKVSLKRFIGTESIQVALDKAGRICLPEEMARKAGITNEAMLNGMLDRFEIWSPERYAAMKASVDVVAHEAFKMME